MDGAQLPPIPQLTLFPGTERQDVDAVAITKGWMSRLDSLLTTRNFNDLNELIIDDGWWRDILGLDWDFTSKQGLGAIAEYLTGAPNPLSGLQCDEAGGLKPLLIELGGMTWIQGGFSFKTPFGEGRGFVRLVNVGPAVWKAWIVFTQLEQLAFQKTLEEQRIRHPSAAPRKATDGVANLPQAGHEEDVTSGAHAGGSIGLYGDQTSVAGEGPTGWRFLEEAVSQSDPSYADQISDLQEKKVVVVGASTSGHDVAQDFVECGAKGVSMIQRNPIFSISAAAFEEQVIGLWNMPGVTTEEADLVGNSIPLAVIRTMSIGMTQSMYAKDKEMVDGLRKAGLAVRTGEDGFGLADHQLIKGGRFYIDQGASQMIVDGRIKIHRCEEGVREFREKSVVLADGTEVEADVVVLATGFQPCVRSVEQVMGAEVAKKLDNLGDLDHENERIGWWRPTGIPGFWYMTGSFLWCRQFSMTLALQIAAIEKGLNPSHYTRSA
ncbi:indole-3-pyruvate monooxygenase YUCCA8 [Apiospora arundinis]|uniref:Indole-3-pyruvate monooxygenase YUCCA8 n=1 Tax=Apiospora arundinis TaxID=335852 RepID=A0ABR2I3D9_9PEZI